MTDGYSESLSWHYHRTSGISFSKGLTLWREDGSVIYSSKCYWVLTAQLLSGPSTSELLTIYYSLIWDWVSFVSPLTCRRATVEGCNPRPEHRGYKIKDFSRPTISRPLCPIIRPPSGARDQLFFLVHGEFFRQLCFFLWVCNVRVLLDLPSLVILVFEPHGNHYRILFPQFWHSPKLEASFQHLFPHDKGSSVKSPGTEFVLYSIHACLLSVQHHYIVLCPDKCCGYNGSFVTWAVGLTAAKFIPLHIPCCASSCPIFRIWTFSRLWLTCACFLHNLVI
jgi:hypothetical protein